MSGSSALWIYLSRSPLLWLSVTLLAWLLAERIARATDFHPLANPIALAVAFITLLLAATGTPYATYFDGAQFVHFLLGPAIVAIGVPLAREFRLVVANLLPMMTALIAGAVTAIVTVLLIGRWLDLPREVLASLVPKSVTTGIAMGITEQIGGIPPLTAAICIVTGIAGAIMAKPLMDLFRIEDHAARGFAAGLVAHGIGTSRAFSVSRTAGTFAGIAMGLNGVATSLIVPLMIRWI